MREVRADIEIATLPETALRAFVDIEMMRRWGGVDRGLVEECEGGVWALAWEPSDKGFRYVTTGTVKSFQPGDCLRIENLVYFNPEQMVLGPTVLTVKVDGEQDKTRVSVCREGYRDGLDWDWYYESVVHGWPNALAHLKRFLESTVEQEAA